MTVLDAVAAYVPAHQVSIDSLRAELGLGVAEMKVFHRYYGLADVPREDGTLTQLMLTAAGKLDALRGCEHRVRFVLYARTVPVVTPYPVNPLHEVRRALGLDHAVAFSVTQHACASGLLAIDLAGRLLEGTGDPDALALVLTGEKAYTRAVQFIPRTTIMGEASAACLVGQDGDRDVLLGYAVDQRGEFDRLELSAQRSAQFQQQYTGLLVAVMRKAAAQAGLGLDDIALILPHNVNVVSWQRLCQAAGIPLAAVMLDNVARTGHCFCTDPFLNYQTAVERGALRPGDHYLMAAVGTGATFSAMLFRH